MSDVSHLYKFRVGVVNGPPSTPMEFRSGIARKIVSLRKEGHVTEDIIAEQKVNGKWEYDTEAYILADKYENKTPAKKEKAEKGLTVKSSLSYLAKTVRLAQSTDTITDEHIQYIQRAYNTFVDVLGLSVQEDTKEENFV